MTLVIVNGKFRVRALWALCSTGVLRDAILSLRKRELWGSAASIVSVNDGQIGCWKRGSVIKKGDQIQTIIGKWALSIGLDAVLWTALGPTASPAPSEQDVVSYLSGLKGKVRQDARRYIRCAPSQIDTDYRRAIEKKLGWTPLDK